MSQADRQMLKQDIFGALDNVVHLGDTKSKVIVSSIENIIYNIAQLDYASWAPYAHQQIQERLLSNDERFQTSALRALKSIFQAFEFEIKEERKPLNHLIEVFFPILEGLLGNEALQNSPNYIPMMILIAKIFFMSIQVSKTISILTFSNRELIIFCRSKSCPTSSVQERWLLGSLSFARSLKLNLAKSTRLRQRPGRRSAS